MIEMHRMKEEERQRILRESIIRKRQQMERARVLAERIYAEKKREELDRKVQMLQEMKERYEVTTLFRV